MIKLSVKWITAVVDGILDYPKDSISIDKIYCSSVAIDSRTINKKSLFIAISGPNFDGHNFIKQAEDKGALAVIVEKIIPDIKIPQIKVIYCRVAIGKLARAYRRLLRGKVIAVTGSNGKTSVKNMLASICTKQGLTSATTGNLNNQLGLPLTLLNTAKNSEYIVLEMGTSYPGEIAILTDICLPDIAIITNAGHSHLDKLHSVKNVAIEKANIITNSTEQTIVVLNKDDQYYNYWHALVTNNTKKNNKKIISFSLTDTSATVYISADKSHINGISFTAITPSTKIEANISAWGEHQLANCCCAIAASVAAGITTNNIIAGLENISLASGRGKRHLLKNNSMIIDESYNANPESVIASVNQLSKYNLTAATIFVFADMLDLGNDSIKHHKMIGKFALQKGISQMLTIGTLAKNACTEFGGKHFVNINELINFLQQQLERKVIILVKGSNKMDLIKVVESLHPKTTQGDTECYYG